MTKIKAWFQQYKEKKGILKWVLPADILLLILLVAGYFIISGQYKNRFIPGTILNGKDVGGMYADQAEQALASSISSYALNMTFGNGVTEAVKGSEISLRMLPCDAIADEIASQNRFAWIGSLFGRTVERTVDTSYAFDDGKLQVKLISMPEMHSSVQFSPKDACLMFDENGRLTIVPEEEGNEIDGAKLLEAAQNAIMTGQKSLVLTEIPGVYKEPALRADDKVLTDCRDAVNKFLDTTIKITMSDGSERVIDDTVLRSWIALRTDGLYSIAPELIEACAKDYVHELALEDDSYGQFIPFRTTQHDIIHLESDEIHGHLIDQDAMTKLILNDLENSWSGNHGLVYKEYVDHMDPDMGGTYIEIDIYGQHIYYYKDGELDFDTPCVTGTEGTERMTPSGIYDVFKKYYDTVLVGPPGEDGTPSYESHVDYFLSFYHGYGMHDATWRTADQFGTDRYQWGGSHGCVNLPYDSAKYLYNNVEIGTPVIVFRAKMSAAEEEAAKAEAEAAFAKEEEERRAAEEAEAEENPEDTEESSGNN